ncbi:MAG: 50S ribosomal protein L25 [Ruoffia tabacinasalis]|uniref:50S ribosomal protein L25 n=1 Tax=unclassified Ruoffia TaxID=2862149 RepID=UPI000EBD7F3C|nr:50S ribosomal protein L25 [Aerococcaceae bacterium]
MNLKAELRETTGSSASRKARAEGKVPVSLYGKTVEATSLLVDRRDFEALLKEEGTNAVFNLDFNGGTQKVWLKDYERAALKDEMYSIDLEAISADQTLTVEIPLYVVNDETIEEGIVEIVENEITVETKPDTIPQYFEVDVKGLEIGDTLTVADIALPEGVEIMMENDETIVSISIPTEEAEDVDPDEEAAEPEVIGATEEEAEEAEEE